MSLVYLDFNATTPVAPEVIQVVTNSLTHSWGNPSSQTAIGKTANLELSKSRMQVASMINAAQPDHIIFTSGGTESNRLAIESAVKSLPPGSLIKPHVVTSNVEHPSVSKLLQHLRKRSKIELTEVPVRPDGRIDANDVIDAVVPSTVLVTIMHANNETGVIMPIKEIGLQLKNRNETRPPGSHRVYFHTDAAQTIGKIPVDVNDLLVDYLTIVGHKFYGPKTGALYVRSPGTETPVSPLFLGGNQEFGFRAGTENVAMISGLGKACDLVSENLDDYMAKMVAARNQLKNLLETIPEVKVNFDLELCLPNTLSIAMPSWTTGAKVLERSSGRVCASLGAACHSNNNESSSILILSGIPEPQARRTIRLSVGRDTTRADIQNAVEALKECMIVPTEIK